MSSTNGLKWVTVLGSTGSIGTSTLDVIARHPDRFRVFALSASTRVEAMAEQCFRFRPRFAVMSNVRAAEQLRIRLMGMGLPIEVLAGEQALCDVAVDPEVDHVMAAIVGAAGLAPCVAAARAGKRLLLANKEALVVGGRLFLDAVEQGGAMLLPIDSEHSAIFQSLPEERISWHDRVKKIILTASGGPFRQRDPATFRNITPSQACAHPNWVMGKKISVDSATMMNKALEVIEASYLFDMEPDSIEVVIHPQSVVHSMVQFRDSSVVAQLGTPDMRVPIAYGLSWPDRMESGAEPLDFGRLSGLTFESPDTVRFPALGLAWEALRAQEGATAVLNAANEVAVAAFLEGHLRFDQIYHINRGTLDRAQYTKPCAVDDLLEIDRLGRRLAQEVMRSLGVIWTLSEVR